jgi:hypothetical protein
MRAACIALSMALMGPASTLAQEPLSGSSALERTVGCYALELGPWSGPFTSGYPSHHRPPAELELDSAVNRLQYSESGIPVSRRLRSRPTLTWATFYAGWHLVGDDSLVVSWSTGFTGLELRLGLAPDTLGGVAEAFHDRCLRCEPTAPVTAWRIPCRSEKS